MKNKLSMECISCCIVVAFIVCLTMACQNEPPQGAQIIPRETYTVYTGKGELIFLIRPENKTGQSIDILSRAIDDNVWKVKEVNIYEDGKLIEPETGRNDFVWQVETTIKHKEPGIHSYFVEYTYTNGKSRRTGTKTVEFTGGIIDNHPVNTRISVHGNELILSANDYGDNRGIVEVELIEIIDGHGATLETIRNNNKNISEQFKTNVKLDIIKTGKYGYYALFKDRGGNIIVSDVIIVDFK